MGFDRDLLGRAPLGVFGPSEQQKPLSRKALTGGALLALVLLGGCMHTPTKPPVKAPPPAPAPVTVCVPVKHWSLAEEQQMAAATAAIPPGSILIELLADYDRMRKAATPTCSTK